MDRRLPAELRVPGFPVVLVEGSESFVEQSDFMTENP